MGVAAHYLHSQERYRTIQPHGNKHHFLAVLSYNIPKQNKMEVKGRVIQVLPEERGQGQKGEWRKQTFILEYGDQYPKKAAFQAWGDKQIPNVGEDVTVQFDVESREYNGRWYTTATAWKIDVQGATAQAPQSELDKEADRFLNEKKNEGDDLPF